MAVDLIVGGLAGQRHIVVAVLDGAGAFGGNATGAAHDTRHIAGDGLGLAVHADVLDGRAVAQAEQRGVVAADVGKAALVLQIQPGDLMVLSVEGAAVVLIVGAIADGRPGRCRTAHAAQVDVGGETGVQLRLAAVHLVGEPLELSGGGDLVVTVLRLCGLVDIRHRHGTLGHVRAVIRGHGDERRSLGNAGDQTFAVHRRHGGCAASPRHLLVGGVRRLHRSRQLRRGVAVHRQLRMTQRHAGNRHLTGGAAGLGVVTHHEVEAVEVLVVIVVVLRRDVQALLQQERGGQRQRMAAVPVLRYGVLVVGAGVVAPVHLAIGIEELAVRRDVGPEVRRIGDIHSLRTLGNGDGVDLLLAGVAEMRHLHGALRDVVEVIRTRLVQRDAGEVEILIVLVGVEGLRAAAHRHSCSGRCVAGVLRTGVGIRRQQVVGTLLLKRIGVAAAVAAVRRDLTHLPPVGIIDLHGQAGDGLKALRAAVRHRARVVLLGLDGQAAAGSDGVAVPIEGGKGAALPEAPVTEHGHVDGVPVRQQHIVRRGAPAGAHQRVHMVAVVHEVLVVTPELLHIHGRGAAGDVQRQTAVVIRLTAVHVGDAHAAVVTLDDLVTVDDLLRRKAQIVHTQQVEIQVQSGGALYHLIVHIAALSVLRMVAVEFGHILLVQIEVGHVQLQMGQHRAFVAHQWDAVVGNGDIDLYRGGVRLIVAVLGCIAVGRLVHRNGELHGRRSLLRAGGGDGGRVRTRSRVGEGQDGAAVLVGGHLGLRTVVAAIQRVGQPMAAAVLKQLVQPDGQQAACGHLIRGLGAVLHGHAGCRAAGHIRRGEHCLRYQRQAQHQTQQHGQYTVGHASFMVHVISSLSGFSLSLTHTRKKE